MDENTINKDANDKLWIDLLASNPGIKVDVTKGKKHNSIIIEKGLKVPLTTHQLYDIDAMIQLENRRGISVDGYITYTGAGVLSEPLGSGKTFVILGLILAQPIPRQYKDIHTVELNMSILSTEIYNNLPIHTLSSTDKLSRIIVKRTFRKVLRPAIIFCGASVAIQWKNTIEEFTNLKYLLIIDVFGVRKLNKMLESYDTTEINTYDLIIVKNGTIVGELEYRGMHELRNQSKIRCIFNIIANITRNAHCAWSRLVIDDFDSIQPPSDCGLVSALFTWIVSASMQQIDIRQKSYLSGTDVKTVLDYYDYSFHKLSFSNILWTSFNVSCAKKFTEKCVNTGNPKFWLYKFKNINDECIKMIGLLDGDNIMEMLNGDAIETAAEEAGIKSTSVIDIFSKILDKKYDIYKAAIDMEAFLNANTLYRTLPAVPIIKNCARDVYTIDDLQIKRVIRYNYPSLDGLFTKERERCISVKLDAGKAIERVKDNIKEGYCVVCCAELEFEDTIINKCCGGILCGVCGIQCSHFHKEGDTVVGKCANCRQKLPITNMVFLNKDFNLDKITTNDCEYEVIEPNVEQSELDKTKIDVLLELIVGDTQYPRQSVIVDVDKLLIGTKKLNDAPITDKTFIIFASYDETLNSIISALDKCNITWRRIGGTASQIASTVKEFDEKKFKVLLLKTKKDCAGLNLQSASDLVFMHKIIDNDLEAQSLGRIQRFGRTTQANIHYLLYINEVSYFTFR